MYDPQCLVLARTFLGNLASNRLAEELAQALQDRAEEWLAAEKARLERDLCVDPGTAH